MDQFDVIGYMRGLQQGLKATSGYEFCRVSDPKMMEEVIQNCRRSDRFFAVDDSQEGMLYQGEGGGWFEQRPVVVFLLGRLSRWPDMDGRQRILSEMRGIYHRLAARLIHDSSTMEELAYLGLQIPFDEIPGEYAGGTAGLFFTFTVDVPVTLGYDGSDWQ